MPADCVSVPCDHITASCVGCVAVVTFFKNCVDSGVGFGVGYRYTKTLEDIMKVNWEKWFDYVSWVGDLTAVQSLYSKSGNEVKNLQNLISDLEDETEVKALPAAGYEYALEVSDSMYCIESLILYVGEALVSDIVDELYSIAESNIDWEEPETYLQQCEWRNQ